MRIQAILLAFLCLALSAAAHASSASILAQAQAGNPVRYQFAVSKGAEIRDTTDNKAFSIWWQPTTAAPAGVIVTLHGHDSFATDEFYLWQPYAQAKGYAILALQWWFGAGEATTDYYQPTEMYPLIAALLSSKGIKPGGAFLHGYSRGSANSYAVAALDAYSGNHYFAMTMSIAGGAATNYPPNQQITAGAYGAKPFTGIQWIMYCGEKDPDPDQSGCPGMTASKDWVTKYGATVKLFIDDPNGDHGGFMTNATNVNAAMAVLSPLVSVTATEFYNATLGHYFLTADSAEAAGIDAGAAGAGWSRTGQLFGAYSPGAAQSGAAKVCRFYGSPTINPATGTRRGPNSHFYTADAAECASVKTDPGWLYESDAFAIQPVAAGACPTGTTPIKRVYNGRAQQNDSNHRFVVGDAAYQAMTGRGWTGEGVVMCAVNATAAATP